MAPDTGQSSDIDIFEVIETILQQKVAVFLTTLVVVLLALAYSYAVPAKQRATITILPPSYAEVSRYAHLNNLLPQRYRAADDLAEGDTTLLDLRSLERDKPFVTPEKMEEVFGASLASFSPIRQALLDESAALAGIDDVEARFDLLRDLSRDYEVFAPDPADGRPFWTMRIETRDVDEAARIVTRAFDNALQAVRQDFLQEAQQIRDSLAAGVDIGIENARRDLDLAKYAYELRLASRLSFLEEQARLARALGIEERQFEAGPGVSLTVGTNQATSLSGSEFGAPQDAGFPYYLHGYLAIEQELATLKSRAPGAFQQYAPDASQLLVQLRAYETDQTVTRIDAAIAQSPLADGSFAAAVYDTQLLRFDKVVGTTVFLLAALIVGLVAGAMVALLRAGLRSRSGAGRAA